MTRKAIIVDDSQAIRNIVSGLLSKLGFQALVAKDSQSALEQINKNKLDLIITDTNISGLEEKGLITKVRELPEYKNVPILVLTTETGANTKKGSNMTGASCWIFKPFNLEVLELTINKLCT